MLIIRHSILTVLHSQLSLSQTLLSQSRFYLEKLSLDTFPILSALRILLFPTSDLLGSEN